MPNDTVIEPQKTTLSALRNPEPPEARMPAVRTGMTDLQGFELMQRVGNALSKSTLVPKEYQNNLPNCLIALEMAQRIGASPLMVTQNLYVVHGRPGWSAKFLIASFNQCGRFTAIRFEWSGKPGADDWGCRAWATEKSTGEKIQGPLITIALAKKEGWYQKNGSKWQTIPELMLTYRAAAWMVNTHAPEISMGLNTAEEINDVYDATRGADGGFAVTTEDLQGQTGAIVDGETGEITNDAVKVTREYVVAQIAGAKSTDDVDHALELLRGCDLDAKVQDELRDLGKTKREEIVAAAVKAANK